MTLALDFTVHVYSRANGPPCCEPGSITWLDETIAYREVLNADVVSSFVSGSGTNGTTIFESVEVPPSLYTGDVISHATAPLLPFSIPASINRQYGVSVGIGPGTLESAFLRTALRSVVDPVSGQQNLYERGISWGRFFPDVNNVQLFTSESLEEYLESRIGIPDAFFFVDNLFINEGGLAIFNRGYLGTATLVSVTAVPEPGTLGLLFCGLAAVLLAARRNVPARS
jgi:hypothetical protein